MRPRLFLAGKMEFVLVKACLNGGTTRREHPAVPQTPAELAADAVVAVRAGAGAIHLHPRDESGAEVLDAPAVPATVTASDRTKSVQTRHNSINTHKAMGELANVAVEASIAETSIAACRRPATPNKTISIITGSGSCPGTQ
jgi:uncharacterized protein (DUF849 family)